MFDFIDDAITSITDWFDTGVGQAVGGALNAGASFFGNQKSGRGLMSPYHSASSVPQVLTHKAGEAQKADTADFTDVSDAWVRMFASTVHGK